MLSNFYPARKILSLFLLVGALAAPTSLSVNAHRQAAAITKLLFNPRTHNIEVMHRFYLHDAEHAVREILGKKADVLNSDQTRADFAEYVQERFTIKSDTGKELALSLVGFEVEGKFLWVYQETPDVKGLKSITMEHNALRDIWPNQINMVNVEGKSKVKTATFDGSIEWITIDLGHQ